MRRLFVYIRRYWPRYAFGLTATLAFAEVQPYFPLLQPEPTRMLVGKMMAFVKGVVVGVDCCSVGTVGAAGPLSQRSENLGIGLALEAGRFFGKEPVGING